MATPLMKQYFNLYSNPPNSMMFPTRFKISQEQLKTQLSTGGLFEFAENESTVTNIVSRLLAVSSMQSEVSTIQSSLNTRIGVEESNLYSVDSSLNTRVSVDESNLTSIQESLNSRVGSSVSSLSDVDSSLNTRVSVDESNLTSIQESLNSRVGSSESTMNKMESTLVAITDGEYNSVLDTLDEITSYFSANSSTADLVALNNRLTSLTDTVSLLNAQFSVLTSY